MFIAQSRKIARVVQPVNAKSFPIDSLLVNDGILRSTKHSATLFSHLLHDQILLLRIKKMNKQTFAFGGVGEWMNEFANNKHSSGIRHRKR